MFSWSCRRSKCSCRCANYASPHMKESNGIAAKRQKKERRKDSQICVSFVSRNKTKVKCLVHKMRIASKLSRDLPWKWSMDSSSLLVRT